ncbi:MAG TPA: ABC transporter permease [Burkholderiales bacterium]|nr:ABC transporter permease [Burkholderiales bacterium]
MIAGAGRVAAETATISALALIAAMGLFGVFLTLFGANPFDVFGSIYRGAFGSWFAWQNTLQLAAPLMLTALCTALPARLGLIVIGGEGALIMGGVAAVAAALAMPHAPPLVVTGAMILASLATGGVWVGLAGALRAYRGVNETISTLLLNYIAIALMNHLVTGPMRDPEMVNRPSSWHIGEPNMIGSIPGMDVHWGLVYGVIACVIAFVLMHSTVFGFAARMIGGNVRAARLVGLPVPLLTITACVIGGAAAGLAGMLEIAAVHGRASSSLVVGYGYTGILVAFIARQNPLAVIPTAMLLGGINASSGLIQRSHDLPDATVLVMQGIIFLMILAAEPFYGRFTVFRTRAA